jgi:hypothetical protein
MAAPLIADEEGYRKSGNATMRGGFCAAGSQLKSQIDAMLNVMRSRA